MEAPKGEETALGSAQARFIDSLPRKAMELQGILALLPAEPATDGPREDLRRRLHALYASALVFREDALAEAVNEGLATIDAARDQNRPLTGADLDVLSRLVERLPELPGQPSSAAPAGTSAPPSTVGGTFTAPVSHRPGASLAWMAPNLSASETLRLGGGPSAADASAALRPPYQGAPLLQMVVHVLALSAAEELAQLRVLLPGDSFELTAVSSVEDALAAARARAPDVVLADRYLAADGDLIRRLRGDPLTDFVPVVLMQSPEGAIDAQVARDAGADDILMRPLDSTGVSRCLGAVTGTLLEEGTSLLRLGDATLEEVADRVAEEIRRGIVDAAERGRDQRIPLGEGAEVLAAAWAAVARVRAFVAHQSGGRVQFVDRPRRGGPALLALVSGQPSEDPLALVGTLAGRRVLVVDDDPAVVWFFAGLLREEGATVIESADGFEALRAARKERPDVIISDILMPHIDGLALCRELKRDPALIDVPVILISWKEDLLQKMRELSAGASGYLRKESGAAQILERVRAVLGPRTRLEAQLKASGEVRGSLEGTGIVPLLRSVRRSRSNARVTIRDTWSLFECELRDGKLVQLTRTASDGSFSRGERALPQLLGASVGRFVVTDSESPVRPMFEGTLDDALHRGARALGSVIDAVSGPSLMRVHRIVFDDETYSLVLKHSPGPVREIIERLHAGEAPATLGATGMLARTLESVLVDLARRGAVREVYGENGEDLIEAALKTRDGDRPMRFASPHSSGPMAANSLNSLRPEPERIVDHGLPSVLDPLASMAVAAHARASDRSGPASQPAPGFSGAMRASSPSNPPLMSRHDPEPPNDEDQSTAELDPMSPEQADRVLATVARRSAPPPTTATQKHTGSSAGMPADHGPASLSAAEVAVHSTVTVAGSALELTEPAPSRSGQPPLATAASGDSTLERAAFAASSTPRAEVAEPDPIAIEDRRSRGTIAAWALAVAVLFAVGFWSERAFEADHAEKGRLRVVGDRRGATAEALAPSVRAVDDNPVTSVQARPVVADGPKPQPRSDALVAPEDGGFAVYPGIIDPSVPVTPRQGLLVVETVPSADSVLLSVNGRRIGELPAKVALNEGIHELAIVRGDRTTYRYLSVRPGMSWVLKEP